MDERSLFFGDLHGNYPALEAIIREAEALRVRRLINLGDNYEHYGAKDPEMNLCHIQAKMANWRSREAGRELVCVPGEWEGDLYVAELADAHVGCGFDERGDFRRIAWEMPIWRKNTLIAAHAGNDILLAYGEEIASPPSHVPLVVLHAHSHSMGVLPEFRWLDPSEKVLALPSGELHVPLEPGKTYWANAGMSRYRGDDKSMVVNYGIHDPARGRISLFSKAFGVLRHPGGYVEPVPGARP